VRRGDLELFQEINGLKVQFPGLSGGPQARSVFHAWGTARDGGLRSDAVRLCALSSGIPLRLG